MHIFAKLSKEIIPMDKMEKKEIKKYLFIAVLAVAVCVIVRNLSVIAKLIGITMSAVRPMIIGLAAAYIFNIIMTGFEQRYFKNNDKPWVQKSRRPVCLALSFLITAAILAMIMVIVIPEVGKAFRVLYHEIPPQFVKLQKYAAEKLKEYPELSHQIQSVKFDWASIAEKATSILTTGVAGLLTSAMGIIGTFTSTVADIALGIVFAIYVLIRKDKLFTDTKRICSVIFGKDKYKTVSHVYHISNETFRSFFVGQFLDAMLLGMMCFIGMTILRLPYAAMAGTLVGVTAFIPIVGAFIGAGVSAFIILTVDPRQAVIFIIFLLCIQQIEGNLIYPKVVGDSVGVPGIWVFAAVTIGGGVFGILGMILGVPLSAVAYKLSFAVLERKARQLEPDQHRNKRTRRRRRKPQQEESTENTDSQSEENPQQ